MFQSRNRGTALFHPPLPPRKQGGTCLCFNLVIEVLLFSTKTWLSDGFVPVLFQSRNRGSSLFNFLIGDTHANY